MSQAQLNHCILLHVLRDRDELDDKSSIAKEFAERNELRKTFWTVLMGISFNNCCIENHLQCCAG